jgi:hypothetical protein
MPLGTSQLLESPTKEEKIILQQADLFDKTANSIDLPTWAGIVVTGCDYVTP